MSNIIYQILKNNRYSELKDIYISHGDQAAKDFIMNNAQKGDEVAWGQLYHDLKSDPAAIVGRQNKESEIAQLEEEEKKKQEEKAESEEREREQEQRENDARAEKEQRERQEKENRDREQRQEQQEHEERLAAERQNEVDLQKIEEQERQDAAEEQNQIDEAKIIEQERLDTFPKADINDSENFGDQKPPNNQPNDEGFATGSESYSEIGTTDATNIADSSKIEIASIEIDPNKFWENLYNGNISPEAQIAIGSYLDNNSNTKIFHNSNDISESGQIIGLLPNGNVLILNSEYTVNGESVSYTGPDAKLQVGVSSSGITLNSHEVEASKSGFEGSVTAAIIDPETGKILEINLGTDLFKGSLGGSVSQYSELALAFNSANLSLDILNNRFGGRIISPPSIELNDEGNLHIFNSELGFDLSFRIGLDVDFKGSIPRISFGITNDFDLYAKFRNEITASIPYIVSESDFEKLFLKAINKYEQDGNILPPNIAKIRNDFLLNEGIRNTENLGHFSQYQNEYNTLLSADKCVEKSATLCSILNHE